VKTARVLPQSIEAERSVLGAVMQQPKVLPDVLEVLDDPDAFYWGKHGLIFSAVRDLYLRDEGFDHLSVSRELDRRHQLEQVGGHTELAALVFETTSTLNAVHHAKIIREAWAKRKVIREFTGPMSEAWNGARATDVIRRVESACIDLRNQIDEEGRATVISGFQLAEQAEKKMKGLIVREPGVPTVFNFLPEMMPGRMYVLGGYAKDGKTVVAVQMLRTAIKAGKRVGFVSIEMSHEDLTDRIVSSYGIPYKMVQRGNIPSPYEPQMKQALGDLARADFNVIDDPGIDVTGIVRHQRLGRYDLLIIDHLHRISYEDARDPRMRLNHNVKTLAKLARSERIPVLLLAQLHRPPNSDGFPRPTMQSFKETSTIEQEASALWAVFRKRDPQTGARLDETEFIVLADRYGPDGNHQLHFRKEEVRFTEVSHAV
jgi:replicative DNA helicase